MSGWAYLRIAVVALLVVEAVVAERLIYWQRRHINVLREHIRLLEQEADHAE